MLRGFYTAASGMITQQRQQEVLANNIANANTPGYKADETAIRSFPEMLIHQLGNKKVPTMNGLNLPQRTQVGPLHTGVYVQETLPDFAQGPIKETGITTDLAFHSVDLPNEAGSLFFTVQNETGDVRYTRNGNFTVDGAGYLVTNEGYYVLDETGNHVQTNGLEFTVSPDGQMEMAGNNAQIGIVYIANTADLVKEANVYNGEMAEINAENPQTAGATFSVEQAYLEQSNVDPMQSTTQMMQAYRNFEQNQRVLKAYDESLEKAVSQIGRLG